MSHIMPRRAASANLVARPAEQSNDDELMRNAVHAFADPESLHDGRDTLMVRPWNSDSRPTATIGRASSLQGNAALLPVTLPLVDFFIFRERISPA
jgi:hypothetical protein